MHTDSELLTRSVAAGGIALHLAAPSAGLEVFGVALFLGGWLLLGLRRPVSRRSRRLQGIRPARAPPLFA